MKDSIRVSKSELKNLRYFINNTKGIENKLAMISAFVNGLFRKIKEK